MMNSSRQDEAAETRGLRTVDVDELKWGRLSDWLQLIRLPNLFTLLSNCVAATIIAVGSLERLGTIIPLFLASSLAYWAGMILNDVHDLEEDRAHRPERPLASGKISPAVAGHIATAMLMLSTILILLVGHDGYWEWRWLALLWNLLLWMAIRLYNSSLKPTLLGPLLMGACRTLNILMVGFLILSIYWGKPFSTVEKFPNTLIAYALGMGVYICGITTYARREERTSHSATLALGVILQIVGLVIIACLPLWTVGREILWELPIHSAYPVLIGLIGLTILNRSLGGVMHPVPRKVQLAVKHAILSIIMIDAAVVLMFAGRWYGIGVMLLLLPALLGAIKIRTT